MFDLARRIFCANVAAMATADLVAFGGRFLVLEFSKSTPDVGVGMSAHGGLPLWRLADGGKFVSFATDRRVVNNESHADEQGNETG